mmetsp:Transcript_524/g.1043  ORF Transcript_524/g.1043 Transcript_524/m.1043 type:complete len:187 (+) Transcript_524:35-595(+)
MASKGSTHRLVVQLLFGSVLIACKAVDTDDSSKSNPKEARRELNTYFNMRLFWKSGYRWQESSSEKKWCMKCKSSKCPKGSGIKIARCSRDDWRQNFFFDDGRIRSRRNKNVCLERQGRSIVLDNCNSSSDQIWDTLRKDEPFQLRIPGNDDKCASQHHHPRDGEKVYMTSCKRSRDSQSDKWIVY